MIEVTSFDGGSEQIGAVVAGCCECANCSCTSCEKSSKGTREAADWADELTTE